MKKIYTLPLAALAVIITAGTFFLKSNPDEGLSEHEMEAKPSAEWELMRLRDPATGKIPEGIRFKELEFAKTLPVRDQFLKGSDKLLASADWKQRGPYNVGGRTRAIAVDATNENILLAGGVSGGMWRSTDGGASWQKTTTPDQLQSVTCITQDTRAGKTNTWYYGTGELVGNSAGKTGAYFHGNGIFKSTDGGLTWQILPSTATNTPQTFEGSFDDMWNIAADPSNLTQDEVYAATYGGVYRSIDGGAKWTRVLGGATASYYTDVTVTPNGVVYAALSSEGTQKGLWRSADGVTWVNITPVGFANTHDRTVIAISPSDENQVYFLSETPGSGFEAKVDYGTEIRSEWHSLWKYIGGSNAVWEDRSLNLPAFGMPTGNFVSQGSYDLEIAVKPDNADHVFIGGTNVYRSTDGFKTNTKTGWIGGYDRPTPLSKFPQYPNHHSDQHAFVFLKSNPNVLINGNDGGIQKTMNNLAERVEWIPLNNGYVTTQFYSVAIDHATPDNNVIVGGLQDNGSWFTNNNDLKKPWSKPLGADGAFSAVADGRSAYYLSTQNGKITRIIMNDNGDTISRRRIDPVGGKDYLFINPFILPHSSTLFVAGGSIIWRNDELFDIPMDGGKDSISIGWDSLPNTRIATGKISALASFFPNGNYTTNKEYLYYGTSDGKVFQLKNPYDDKAIPKNITGSNFPKNAYVNCIATDPRDSNTAIVVFSNYSVVSLFLTKDGGTTWTPVAGNLEQNANGSGNGPSTRWVSILPLGNGQFKPNSIYLVGTSTGIYSTSYLDGESTKWVQEGANSVGNVPVDMLVSRTSDGLVVAGTHGNGVYSASITAPHSLPLKPQLVSPADFKGGIQNSEKLEWTAIEGVIYTLEITNHADSTYQIKGLKDNFYTLNNLPQGFKTFTWRVRATNEGGISEFSEARTFITAVAPPVLKSPAEQEITGRNPLLEWEPSVGATRYHLQVSSNLTFSKIIAEENVLEGTSFQLPALEPNTKYYWRVSAKAPDGEGIFSPRKSFTTNGATSVSDADNSQIEFFQSYPNPFKSSSTIRFKTTNSGNISLTVYDVTGRKIAVLKDGFADAGENSVAFKSENLPNGKYFITLSGKGFVKTIPVEILR